MSQSKLDILKNEIANSLLDLQRGLAFNDALNDKYIKYIHNKYSIQDIDNLLEKIILKYESDAYYRREFKMGREPVKFLYDLVYDYAEKYGTVIEHDDNMFFIDGFILGSYAIKRLFGQSSYHIIINKIEE